MLTFSLRHGHYDYKLKATLRDPNLPPEQAPAPASLDDLYRMDHSQPEYVDPSLWPKAQTEIAVVADRAAAVKARDNGPDDLNPEPGITVIRTKVPGARIDEILQERDGETRLISQTTIDSDNGTERRTQEYVAQGSEVALCQRVESDGDRKSTSQTVYHYNVASGTLAIFS